MADLVALALPGGPDYVDAIKRTWARGDAVFPLDSRLPKHELALVLEAVAPSAVIEADGERRSLDGGHPVDPGDAAVIATSGTTGHPKGVVHTHQSLAASAHAISEALAVDPATDRWLACLPLAHVGGFAVITRSIITDTSVEVHPTFDPAAVITAAQHGATLVSLVTRALAQIDTNLFRTILIGGAAPPPDRPANVIATYGLTETGSGVVYERRSLRGLEIRVDDADEIWLRGPMLLRAYRTGSAFTDPKDAEGWFPTGDLGRWNEGGNISVDGRKGDVIATGGEKVWPERAEAVLARQPGVAEVAIVGRPHPEWGHQVVAVIVPDPANQGVAPGAVGSDQSLPDLEQLRDAVKAELPVWYAPTAIELVDALPRTALGKLRRGKLRQTSG